MAITNSGKNFITQSLVGSAINKPFNNINTYIAIGSGTTSFQATQTSLDSEISRVRIDLTYPQIDDSVSGQVVVNYRAVFPGTEANGSWQEWGLFNASTGGTMLNRVVQNNGTKTVGQTWILNAKITYSISYTPPYIVPVTGVTLNKSSSTITIGQLENLVATVLPLNATNPAISWQSSNNNVITVTPLGQVKGIGVGTAQCIATTQDGNYSATTDYTVIPVPSGDISVASISLDKTEVELLEDSTDNLVATILPSSATNKSITWSSSDTSIITCTPYQNYEYVVKVVPVNLGIATITATTDDGGYTASARYTVTQKTIDEPTLGIITLPNAYYTILEGEDFVTSFSDSATLSYPVYCLFENQSFVASSYVSSNHLNFYTTNLTKGIYTVRVVGIIWDESSKAYKAGSYSDVITLEVQANITPPEPPIPSTDEPIVQQYSNSHEAIPNCPDTIDWKYSPRMGKGSSIPNSYINGLPWTATSQWATVYLQSGKSLVSNVGVELTDFKYWRYNTTTNTWILISDTFDYGAFYLEDFWDDNNAPLNSHKRWSSDKKSCVVLMDNETSGRCFHPFSFQYNWSDFGFDPLDSTCYVVAQVAFRLVNWYSSGPDNRASANLVVNVGGDYWIYKDATFDPQWRHNSDFAIGKFLVATNDYKYAYATSCPSSWPYGFPTD